MRGRDRHRHGLRAHHPVPKLVVLAAGSLPAGGWTAADQYSALHPASPGASLLAGLWWGMLIVGTAVLVVVLVLLLVGIFRSRGGRPERPLGSRQAWALVLAGGVAAPLVAAAAMTLASLQISQAIEAPRQDAALTIDIVGQLWWWEVRYYDEDGREIAATANEIHVPAGEPVMFRLKSDNVIHSFWAPNLFGKTDLIPNQVNVIRLDGAEAGIYRGQCAEFCGVQHAFMGFLVVVEPPEDFRSWLDRQGRPARQPQDAVLARGRDVFMASSCPACHTVRGTPADGELGPDLTHIAGRRTLAAAMVPNTRGHLGGWIADPQHIKPGALMPPTPIPPDDFQALLLYLESLE